MNITANVTDGFDDYVSLCPYEDLLDNIDSASEVGSGVLLVQSAMREELYIEWSLSITQRPTSERLLNKVESVSIFSSLQFP